MLERILKSTGLDNKSNRKYAITEAIAFGISDIAPYIVSYALEGQVTEERRVVYTLASKTLPFMAYSVWQYRNNPKFKEVVFSQTAALGVTWALGYPIFLATLEYNLLPRPIAPVVLHVAGAVSAVSRALLDRHNGVHYFGPTLADLAFWRKNGKNIT